MTRAEIEARLEAIADEVTTLNLRLDALFAERLELWIVGRDEHDMKSHQLAEPSRVQAVTVRQLMPPREE